MIIVYGEDGRIEQTISTYPAEHPEFLASLGVRFFKVEEIPRDVHSHYHVAMRKVRGEDRHEPELAKRPACGAKVAVSGRTISLSRIPAGSTVTATLDGVTVPVTDRKIEVDEPGAIKITITPPWPFVEAVHDLEIE
ncbi:MAG: hypothetical protein E5X76_20155 [Mesorhizobium sp.]|nr:MAG: hypothetical protein E5X76_20155 [Mesorhizobium sp.]